MISETEEIKVATGIVPGDMSRHISEFIEFSASSNHHNPSIYYFGIVASACYLESVLEEFCSVSCKTIAQKDEGLQNRLMQAVAKDVSRATGLSAWKKWLKVLFNVDFTVVCGDNWKALDILFQLRNQLAHGRTTKFSHYWNAENGKFLGLSIVGSSYEASFSHLLDKGIISIPSGEVPTSEMLLSQEVAIYFRDVVNAVIISLEGTPDLVALTKASRNENK